MSKVIFSVSELNLATQKLLEEQFPSIWVEGEISNLARPTSGHLYFSLKDPKAQIRCAMFRFKAQGINFDLRNGLLVQILAKVSLYPDRGDYQLIVEKVEMAGDGLLKKAYEELVKKLASEGLFLEEYKKPLPILPKHIGIVTSTTGAAVRDILSVLKRRFPVIPITIYPTKVQGNEAAPEIVKAIKLANQHAMADVLIVARGGGSLEDLWPFNEEVVARAIFNSQIPIVSGVGHEIDFTIADLVADRRAPTPSAAAELVVPLQSAFVQQLLVIQGRLVHLIGRYLQHKAQRTDWLQKRLRHPGEQIKTQMQRLNMLEIRLKLVIQRLLKDKEMLFSNAQRALEAVSPLATLNRGFAIVSHQNKIVDSKEKLQKGDNLQIRLKDGIINTEVI